MMFMINSAAVENLEPFGKAFYSQHPFAAIPREGAESTNETLSLSFLFYFVSFLSSMTRV